MGRVLVLPQLHLLLLLQLLLTSPSTLRAQYMRTQDLEILGPFSLDNPGLLVKDREVQSTGNPTYSFKGRDTIYRVGGTRAPPTGSWWQDLALSEKNATTVPVSSFPFLLRAQYDKCGIDIGVPRLVVNQSEPARNHTPFATELQMFVGSSTDVTTHPTCYPLVTDSNYFGVRLEMMSQTTKTNVSTLHLVRGHPFITTTVRNQRVYFNFTAGVSMISRHIVTNSYHVDAGFLDITDKNSTRWLIRLPAVHQTTVFENGLVDVEGAVDGTVRIALVPDPVSFHTSTTSALSTPSFVTLHDGMDCMVTHGKIVTNHTKWGVTPTRIGLTYTWQTIPAGCHPLMLTLPHHRNQLLPSVVEKPEVHYDSIYGELRAVMGRTWQLSVPLLQADPAVFQDSEKLCSQVDIYNAMLDDKARIQNTTLSYEYEYSVQLYHLSRIVEAGHSLTAVSFQEDLQVADKWLSELLDAVLEYDTWWGVVCPKPVYDGRSADPHPLCWGERHLEHYGLILTAFLRLWPHLLNSKEGTEKVRMQEKLRILMHPLVRDIATLSERDEYFPIARGFDWYTGHAWDRTGFFPLNNVGRVAGNPGVRLLAYHAVAVAGFPSYLNFENITLAGEILYSLEAASFSEYWFQPELHAKNTSHGLIVQERTYDQYIAGEELKVLEPYDASMKKLLLPETEKFKNGNETWLAQLDFSKLAIMNVTGKAVDLMVLGLVQPKVAYKAFKEKALEGELGYNNATDLDTHVGGLSWLLDLNGTSADQANEDCAKLNLSVRVLGTTIWYKDSFNYLFKTMEYQPTLIGRKATSYNPYNMDVYGTILQRDLRLIKSLGFNTVKIPTASFNIDAFIEYCKELDISVIVAQILPAAGFSFMKYSAESDFVQMLEYLSTHENIVMWSIDSTALSKIEGDLIDYYILLYKLKLLRDKYDPKKRPILIPMTEFTVPKLTVDKELYDKSVEVGEITTMTLDVSRLEETVEFLNHPVIINFQSDSWNHVNATDDEGHQATYLKENILNILPMHSKQLLSGISVREWIDQYWRASESDPDHDCPDLSEYRHATCGVRVVELYDGSLTVEYMGINSQRQTWFKHCIRHKAAYYSIQEAFNGTADPEDTLEDCVFVSLEEEVWAILIAISGLLGLITCILIVIVFFKSSKERRQVIDPFDTTDEGAHLWAQPDSDEVYALAHNETKRLLDYPPFAELTSMHRQRYGESDEESDEGSIHLDSWKANLYQVVTIQYEHLLKLLADEMFCQLRCGDRREVGETENGFAIAVAALHARYTNSYLGWYDKQLSMGADLGECRHVRWEADFSLLGRPEFAPIPQFQSDAIEQMWNTGMDHMEADIDSRRYTAVVDRVADPSRQTMFLYEDGVDQPVGAIRRFVREGLGDELMDQLIDLLALLSIWHAGEQMTWFSGHWLSWCFHYYLRHMELPPVFIINDPRHFEKRTVTMDDINESCVQRRYFDVTGTKGTDEGENKLFDPTRDEGERYNEEEIKRYPFVKTFREPRKWGVFFSMIHNIYFIVHTQIISFFFWAFVVSVSAKDQKLADMGISGMFNRMELVFFHSPTEFTWICCMCSKIDFWLVVVGEIMDIWMVGGVYHHTSQDWGLTFLRVNVFDYVKLRWSSYTSVIAFIVLMGETFWGDRSTADSQYVLIYVLIRILGIVINNCILVAFPIRLPGAPRHQTVWMRSLPDFLGSMLFWILVYASVQLFQAWVMFRTETITYDLCGCTDDYGSISAEGLATYAYHLGSKIFICADAEPRCFSAVTLIWITSIVLFVVVINAGFLVWTLLFAAFSQLLRQWRSRKARSLVGKKIQTAYILRTLNIKMLGFTDTRDTSVARKLWNKVIFEMWDENILSAFEYENLLILAHVREIQFNVKNDFAVERLSNFLEYIQTMDEDSLGPPLSYPSVSIIIPVYGEDIMCPASGTVGAFNEKIRSHQQEQTQLHFLVDNYADEWRNFVEFCVVRHKYFHDVLEEDQVEQMQKDLIALREETDEKKKRDMKGDPILIRTVADKVADLVHTQPHLFYPDEMVAVQWWVSMHTQTVARTVRGMERKRDAFQFLLELEYKYTKTGRFEDRIETFTDDKFQLILALQQMSGNEWYTRNEQGLLEMWERYPKVQVSFPIDKSVHNYKNNLTVLLKVYNYLGDFMDCMDYLTCLAAWDIEQGDWVVISGFGRRNQLRLEKQAHYGLNGLMQGKACNQSHSIVFATGQLIQAIDANQDGYFEEGLKLRSVLGQFFPDKIRTWSRHKIVGFPEYSITQRSGIIGRIAAYSEYVFVNMQQKVLAHPLGVRMHYGHPDFFDKSWCVTQGGMSKPNPLINLNEDIFAGYHVTGSGEAVDHLNVMREGKGRETNFDGANGFQMKLAFGASMQYRTRDQFELMRVSDVLRRHSIFYGSVGSYVYIIAIVALIYCTLFINIALSYSYKTDYEISSRGSPYGSEWMVQMSLIEAIPLLVQLTLDFGLAGFLTFIRDVIPTTLLFLFLIMTKFSYFIQSSLNGSSSYVATGRSDPLFRRSLRHMYRLYGHTHFMPGMLLFMIVWLYMDIDSRSPESALWRTFWHWGVGIAWIVTPCIFNPALDLKGLWEDLKAFYLWVFGEKVEKHKEQADVLTKAKQRKSEKFWDKVYSEMRAAAIRQHKRDEAEGNYRDLHRMNSSMEDSYGNIPGDDFGDFGEEVATEAPEDDLQAEYPWNGAFGAEDVSYKGSYNEHRAQPSASSSSRGMACQTSPSDVDGCEMYEEHRMNQPENDDDLIPEPVMMEMSMSDLPDLPTPREPLEPEAPTGRHNTEPIADHDRILAELPYDESQGSDSGPRAVKVSTPEQVPSDWCSESSHHGAIQLTLGYDDAPQTVRMDPPADSDGERQSFLHDSDGYMDRALSMGASSYDTMKRSEDKSSVVPPLTLAKLQQNEGTAAAFRTSRTDGEPHTAHFRKLQQQGAKHFSSPRPQHEEEEEVVYDYDWLCKMQPDQAKLALYADVFKRLPGRALGPNTHDGKCPNKVVGWKAMQEGFLELGKVVFSRSCFELMEGLMINEANFVQFVVMFEKAEGTDAMQEARGIRYADMDVNLTRATEYKHIMRQLRKLRRNKESATRQALLIVLHNSRREFKIKIQDSTADKNMVKAHSLKHHWKIMVILGQRKCSTMSSFMFSLMSLGLWMFCYFALWQDVLWEVFYIVLAISWDYMLTVSNVGPITLVTRVLVAVFLLYRLIAMIQVDNVFYPTVCLTYWLIHVVLDCQFAFWACFGPYFIRNTRWASRVFKGARTLDEQREACLVQLLRDERERYLWGFPYYMFARQLLAVMIGLMQFVFGIILLLIRSIRELIKYIARKMDNWHHKRNPTELTYIAAGGNSDFIQDNETKGPLTTRWTNTITPKTANKMCQVTDPSCQKNYYGKPQKLNLIGNDSFDRTGVSNFLPPSFPKLPSLPSFTMTGGGEKSATNIPALPLPPKVPDRQVQSLPSSRDLESSQAGPGTVRDGYLYSARGPRSANDSSAGSMLNPQWMLRRNSNLSRRLSASWQPKERPVEPGGNPLLAISPQRPSLGTGTFHPGLPDAFADDDLPVEMPRGMDDGLQEELVYFAPEGAAAPRFVASEAFENVADFRRGMAQILNFRGPINKMRLQIAGVEVKNSDAWPVRTSTTCYVEVLMTHSHIHRERKTAVSANRGDRGPTMLEARLQR